MTKSSDHNPNDMTGLEGGGNNASENSNELHNKTMSTSSITNSTIEPGSLQYEKNLYDASMNRLSGLISGFRNPYDKNTTTTTPNSTNTTSPSANAYSTASIENNNISNCNNDDINNATADIRNITEGSLKTTPTPTSYQPSSESTPAFNDDELDRDFYTLSKNLDKTNNFNYTDNNNNNDGNNTTISSISPDSNNVNNTHGNSNPNDSEKENNSTNNTNNLNFINFDDDDTVDLSDNNSNTDNVHYNYYGNTAIPSVTNPTKGNTNFIDSVNLESLPVPLHKPIKELATTILGLTSFIESKHNSFTKMDMDKTYLPKSIRINIRLTTKKDLQTNPEYISLRTEMENDVKQFQSKLKEITLRNITNEINCFKNIRLSTLINGLVNISEALVIHSCFLSNDNNKPKSDNKTLSYYIICKTLMNKSISEKVLKYLSQNRDNIYNNINEHAKKFHPVFVKEGFPNYDNNKEYLNDKILSQKLSIKIIPIIEKLFFNAKTKIITENLLQQADKLTESFFKQKEIIDLTEATAQAVNDGTLENNKNQKETIQTLVDKRINALLKQRETEYNKNKSAPPLASVKNDLGGQQDSVSNPINNSTESNNKKSMNGNYNNKQLMSRNNNNNVTTTTTTTSILKNPLTDQIKNKKKKRNNNRKNNNRNKKQKPNPTTVSFNPVNSYNEATQAQQEEAKTELNTETNKYNNKKKNNQDEFNNENFDINQINSID